MSSAPDWVTLTEGEEVVWSGRPSVYPHLAGLVFGVAVVLIGVAVLAGAVDRFVPEPVPSVAVTAVGGLFVAYGVLSIAKRLVKWLNVRYLITTEEVYHKHGLVSRTVTNLHLDQVQNTTFTESVLGRALSYGDVRIDTAGHQGTEMVFEDVPNPGEVVGRISEQLSKQRSR